MDTPGDRALEDLKRVIRGALRTNGALLTGGEAALARRLLLLDGDAGRLYVRLLNRKGDCFRLHGLAYEDVLDLDGAVAELKRVDLAHCGLPWDRRLPLYTLPELKEACRALGLPRSGRRALLEERLRGREGWAQDPVLRIAGRRLVRRLELLWFRSPWRDRRTLLLERLGQSRWADYPVTGGGRCYSRREGLQRYLQTLRGGDEEPERLVALVAEHPPRPAWLRGLDPRRIWVDRAQEAARQREREGDLAAAASLYSGLLAAGVSQPGPLARRLALVQESLGAPADGADTCALWAPLSRPENRPGLTRTGRRLARKGGAPWTPPPPLRVAPERTLTLSRDAKGTWSQGQRIEPAVIKALAPRRALHGENLLWTTLFGLVFLDLYWAPVPGMLPAPYLPGPVDLGTPLFLENRRSLIEQRMSEGLSAHLRRNHRDFEGCIARGVRWDFTELSVLEALADSGRPVIWRLLREGWGAARGLPDLALLPGEVTRIPALFPSRLPAEVLLIEVKGPNDQLRDEQRVWHDAMLREGMPIEVWRVRASS